MLKEMHLNLKRKKKKKKNLLEKEMATQTSILV